MALLLWALVCELLALISGSLWPSLLSAGLYALFFVAHWRSLLPYPRRLGLATLTLAGLWLLSPRPSLAVAGQLAAAFAYYASFIAALGLTQCLVKRLPQLANLHQLLLNGPAIWLYPRYLCCALLLGSLLSFGMLNLLCGTLQQHLHSQPLSQEARAAGQRGVLTSALRGFALVPLLAPTSVTMAIISRELPGLGWTTLLPFGIAAALLLSLIGWSDENKRLGALMGLLPAATGQALRGPIVGGLVGIAAIALLASLSPLSPTQAAMLVIPIAVAGWLWHSLKQATAVHDELASTLAGMRNEVFIFGCAALLGGLAGQLLPLHGLAATLAVRPELLHLIEAAALLGVIGLALLGVAPIVTLSLLAALLAQLAALGVPPLGPAVALVCGFAMAMLLSPFGPSALILSRLSGVSPWHLAVGWNARLVVISLPLLLLLPLLA